MKELLNLKKLSLSFVKLTTHALEEIIILFDCAIFLLDSFRKTKETFGQINIVCNNAGILASNEFDAWEKVVDVNLVGMP